MVKKSSKEKEVAESHGELSAQPVDLAEGTNQEETPKKQGKPAKHPPVEELIARVEELDNLNAEWKDKYLRLSAEFDNYRKRTLKEKGDMLKTAGEDIFISLLPVVDDIERGLKNLEHVTEVQPVREGMVLIYNKFKDFLAQKGVKEIHAQHEAFNIEFHEAITLIPAPAEELKGKVVDEIEKGYLLHDKVIRYAKVVVGE